MTMSWCDVKGLDMPGYTEWTMRIYLFPSKPIHVSISYLYLLRINKESPYQPPKESLNFRPGIDTIGAIQNNDDVHVCRTA